MFDQIWCYKDYDFDKYDLCIEPKLLEIDSEVHNNKLFDTTDVSNPSLRLSPGKVIDTSKQRGQLVNISKNRFAYIGQKLQLHEAIS